MSKHRPAHSSRTVNPSLHAPWLARAVILAAVTIAVTATAHAADYYVAENGKDSNPGTINSPWKSIQYAANRVQAGDTVNVRGGTYTESISVKSSGSASQGYVTFQSFAGETAKISGKNLAVTDQQGLINIVDKSYIKIIGFDIGNYTTSRADLTPIGIRIAGKGDAIKINDNHIHDISSTAAPSTNRDCEGSNPQAHGILVVGTNATSPILNLVIDHNQLDHLTLGCSEALAVNGNVLTWEVTNNEIHDNNNIGIDAIGFEKNSSDPKTDQARDGKIIGNKVYNNSSSGNKAYTDRSAAGIYCDGCTLVTIEANELHDNDYGVEVASEHEGGASSYVTVRSNLIYNNALSGLTIGGSGDKNGGTDNCTFVNNSFYGNDTTKGGTGELQIQYKSTNNTFQNNIIYAGSPNVFIFGEQSSSAVTADGNLYYSTGGDAAGQWTLKGTPHNGFANYVKNAKQDAASKFADPQYRDVSKGDLRVAKTSPAVDRGLSLPEKTVGTTDFVGAARVQGQRIDIGAYEQQAGGISKGYPR